MEYLNKKFKQFTLDLEQEISKELPGFDAQKSMSPSIREDLIGNTRPNEKTRQSAVLILLFPVNGKISTVFIKRQVYDGPHSGQVSFPGGKFDKTDISLIHTALREAQEEIGINSTVVQIIGTISPLYIPVSNMMVTPVVGFMETMPDILLNQQEVEYTITVALEELTEPTNKCVKIITSHGKSITAPYYNVSNEMVWGATAMILSEFLELITRVQKKR